MVSADLPEIAQTQLQKILLEPCGQCDKRQSVRSVPVDESRCGHGSAQQGLRLPHGSAPAELCGDNLGVGGTPGYMAPEVVLGTSKPSTDTDLFSLSVILFELFFLAHPLEGANCCKYPCLTQQIEKDLYAIHPVFVCSNTDRSNAPVRGTSSNLMNLWPIYPEYLHDAFQQAFSEDGLKNGSKRGDQFCVHGNRRRILLHRAGMPQEGGCSRKN